MREAIALALDNVRTARGGPFAALVVTDGQVIATGTNRVTSNCDPTAHAEIVAIREACSRLGRFELSGCEIYATCEPCPMCLAAIYWARLDRVIYAASRHDAASAGFDDAHIYAEISRPPDERVIPMEQTAREEALRVFRAWTENPDSIAY